MSEFRIFFDTSVLIDLLTADGEDYEVLVPLIEEAEMGAHVICVSEVTIAEVSKLGCSDETTTAQELIAEFFANEYTRRFPVTANISEYAATLVEDYNLETCDAIIVATAALRRGEALYTGDRTKRKRLRRSKSPPSVVPSVRGTHIIIPREDPDLRNRVGLGPYEKPSPSPPPEEQGVEVEAAGPEEQSVEVEATGSEEQE